MTTYDKATLKTFFQQNDVPTGTDYANLIDSQVNLVETTAQSMAGSLFTPELITSRVSASNLIIGGNTFALSVGNNATIGAGNTVSVSGVNFFVSANSNINLYGNSNVVLNAGGTTSLSLATNINLNATNSLFIDASGSVFVSAGTKIEFDSPKVYSPTGFFGLAGITSATGSAQSTAALLTNITTRAKGVVDGQTTGFQIPSNKAGLTQYIYNDVASANLWPCTGGTINALGANAAFGMTANTLYTIAHIAASAYAVK